MVTRRRQRVFAAGFIVVALILVEVTSRMMLPLADRLGADVMTLASRMDVQRRHIALLLDSASLIREQLDPDLGWVYRPGYEDATDRINSVGLRSDREYSPTPDADVRRIAVFGDSFTYGNEVANGDEWPAVLEAIADRTEVLNFGVGGYGMDQAFLRYLRDGRGVDADYVVLGFSPVDLPRAVNVNRQFLGAADWPLTKPRFRTDSAGRLELLPNPLPRPEDYRRVAGDVAAKRQLGAHDQWYRTQVYWNPLFDHSATVRMITAAAARVHQRLFDPNRMLRGPVFNEQSEAFRIHVALFQAFADSVRAVGGVPVILILPDRESVERSRAGQRVSYEPLLSHIRDTGAILLDGIDAFTVDRTQGASGWFAPHGHYSAAGNRQVAVWLERSLQQVATPERHHPAGLTRP